MKRLSDVILSAIGLTLFLPLMLLLSTLVATKIGLPILFTQVRPGLRSRPFKMYKFRTMHQANDANGQPLPDELRLPPFGKFLRSTSLDELPELWNVLKGDMSMVGPRPLLMDYLPLYSAEENRRHEVRPGITGWAQINGRNAIGWEEKFALDVWYVDNRSLLLDMKILWKTLSAVLFRRGITNDVHATMPPFRGHRSSKSTGKKAKIIEP